MVIKNPRFELGQTVTTRAVADRMEQDPVFAKFCEECLQRHSHGDWGDIDIESTRQNNEALRTGEERLFSSYIYCGGDEKLWIITEWDHSATTLLFPSDY